MGRMLSLRAEGKGSHLSLNEDIALALVFFLLLFNQLVLTAGITLVLGFTWH